MMFINLIQKWLDNRWVRFALYTILAIIAFILIWVLLNWCGLESDGWKWFIEILVFGGFFGWLIVKSIRANKKRRVLASELNQQQHHERNGLIIKLTQQFNDAIKTLKRSSLKEHKQHQSAIYSLPWFVVLGSESSGKTSLLRYSGLNFSIMSEDKIHAIGEEGTETCDFWYSDEAIFIDTAGRYSHDDASHQEWLHFLSLLKHNRWRLPANGLILTINIKDLLTLHENELLAQAQHLRKQIDDVNEKLGYILPIHIAVTQLDLLQGFTELSDILPKEKLNALLGFSLNYLATEDGFYKQYQEKSQSLLLMLGDLLVKNLNELKQPDQRLKATQFLCEFEALLDKTGHFLSKLFRHNPYQAIFNLKSIGFMSVLDTEEKWTLIENKKLTEDDITGYKEHRTVFVKDYLNSIITSPSRPVMNRRSIWIDRSVNIGLLTLASLILIGLMYLWINAYSYNSSTLKNSLNSVVDLKSDLHEESDDPWSLLSSQLIIYEQYNQFEHHHQLIPFHQRMGLYAENGTQTVLQKTLADSLQYNLLRPLIPLYEQKLEHLIKRWPTLSSSEREATYMDYYQTLKDYQLLAMTIDNPDDADVNAIAKTWADWLAKQTDNEENDLVNSDELANLVRFYLENPYSNINSNAIAAQWLPKTNLVNAARAQLRRPIDTDVLLMRLQTAINNRLPDVKVNQLLPSDAAAWFSNTDTIPGMYTKAGWEKMVKPTLEKITEQASAGDWVLSQPIALNTDPTLKPTIDSGKPDLAVAHQLQAVLLQSYLKNYLNAWYRWMSDLSMRPFGSLEDAGDNLIKIGKTDGPMPEVLATVADNLSIENSVWDVVAPSHGSVLTKAWIGAGDFITTLADDHANSTIRQYLSSIKQAQSDISTLSVNANQEQAARTYAIGLLTNNASGSQLYQARMTITQLTNGVANPDSKAALVSLLSVPLKAAWQAVLNSAAGSIQKSWQTQVLPVYQNEIAGKAPFTLEGENADFQTVQDFLAPNTGVYWQFVNQQLVPFVQLQGNHWKLNQWMGVGMNLSSDFMRNLDQAQQLSILLVPAGGTAGQFNYSVYPEPNPSIIKTVFAVNDQHFVYENGPQEWLSYHWSLNAVNPETSLYVIKSNDEEAKLYMGGQWSLFKLLRKADSMQQANGGYMFNFKLNTDDGRVIPVTIGFRSNGQADAVEAFVKQDFSAPSTLVGN